jgi:hypothetical protein
LVAGQPDAKERPPSATALILPVQYALLEPPIAVPHIIRLMPHGVPVVAHKIDKISGQK